MSDDSFQLLCDLGRPCPNFQRLIEYLEPVEGEGEDAAGDGLQWGTDLRRRTPCISASMMRWNPQTSRLRINPCTLRNPRLPNYPQRRRPNPRNTSPKESFSEMTKKMENTAEVRQPKQEGTRPLQTKPIVKIKPNSSSPKPCGSITRPLSSTWTSDVC